MYSICCYHKIFTLFSVLCSVSLELTYFIYSSLYLLISYPLSAPPPSLFLPVTTSLWVCFFCALFTSSFYCLDFTYEWYHAVFVFLCLTYFTEHNTLQVHPCCCKLQNFTLFMGESTVNFSILNIVFFSFRISIWCIFFFL